jgi:RNA-binding protein
MPPELSSKRRSELRAEAHQLKPIVLIGDKGLTDEVMTEIDRALNAHELIKVRASTDDRDARDVWLESICQKLEAHAVQQIGKIFVLYREKPAEEKAPSPRPSPRREGEKRAPPKAEKERRETKATAKQRERSKARPPREDGKGLTRSARPRSRTPSPLPASESRRRRPRTSR